MSNKCYHTYGDVRVVCPFYKGEEERSVRCEGVLRGSTLTLYLASPKRKRAYMVAHCTDLVGCGQCAINQMMTAIYNGQPG